MIYKATKQGLPAGVNFSKADFVRPVQSPLSATTALLTNIEPWLAPTTVAGVTITLSLLTVVT